MEQLNAAGNGGREVVYEGQIQAEANPNRRYISPPPHTAANEPIRNQSGMPSLAPPYSASSPAATAVGRLDLPVPPGSGQQATTDRPAITDKVATSSRPWVPLLLTLLGLFGSLGFNFYLGWIAWDLYSRYQDAVDDVQEFEAKLEAKQLEIASTTPHRASARTTVMASA